MQIINIMKSWFYNLVRNYYNDNLGYLWKEYSVFDLEFSGDSITANVTDRKDWFYVSIKFRQFTVHEKDKLLSIARKDEIKHDLIRGIVPEALFDCGVNIFPQSSIDFVVDCSCWSTGLLCNEAVAVLNRLRVIFKDNPFLIFSLRGLDLNNVDMFPTKRFSDIFNNTYNTNLEFILDENLHDHIRILRDDLTDLTLNHKFKSKSVNLKLPVNLNSSYSLVL